MKTVVVVGASGFIGENLIRELVAIKSVRVIAITRDKSKWSYIKELPFSFLDVIEIDLSESEPELIGKMLPSDSVIINLAYNWHAGKDYNLHVMKNLVDACSHAGVSRFIQVSTAAVVGRVKSELITEYTKCSPVTTYGVTKLLMEKALVDRVTGDFDSIIIRPTSVFGPGGAPLKKLIKDILEGSKFKNYVKSCLFGARRMNLTNIKNVTSAIIFFINHSGNFENEIYIVSEDFESNNNFGFIEKFLMEKLDVPYYSFRFALPSFLLSICLWVNQRNNINPNVNFSSEKLLKAGYKPPVTFINGLEIYAEWAVTECRSV